MPTHGRLVGSTLFPLNLQFTLNGDPVNLAAYTVKVRVEDNGGTVIVNNSSTGVTAHPTQVFTAEADDDYLTCLNHGVKDGNQIVVANSGGALPTGLSASTPYFPVNITPNRFQLAVAPGATAINLTTDGTGTNTFYVKGSAQYAPPVGVTGTVQLLRLWGILESGSDIYYFPDNERGAEVEIKAVGN